MTKRYEVAVVGLGAMGAATLYQLARRGVAAVGLDRFAPPHARGSSHGETRITREAVGEGAEFVPLVQRSHAIWRELEATTGKRLFSSCGGLVIGRERSTAWRHAKPDFIATTIELAERFQIPHEVLDRVAMARRFPQFTGLGPDEIGYFEPGAGFVRPEACIEAQLSEAVRLGAEIRTGIQVTSITQDEGLVRIGTPNLMITADQAVIAAGAWTGPLLGRPFDEALRVTRQTMYWFAPAEPALFAEESCPVFIRLHGDGEDDFFYGFPVPGGGFGVKAATERFDVTADPDGAREVLSGEAERFFDTHLAGRVAGLDRRPVKSASCLYTSTADSGFIIDRHPRMDRVMVVSACSGHGFKHSAAIGERVAESITAGTAPEGFNLA